MTKFAPARGWAPLAAAASVMAAPVAWAQSAPAPTAPTGGAPAAANPSRQEINPVERTPPPAPRASDLFTEPAPPPCPLQDSTLTFQLAGVDVEGAATVPKAAIDRLYARDIGKSLPVSQICALRDRLSSLLFARGLLARVEVPEQRIADGRLKLEVIEARIVSIRVHGDIGAAQGQVEAYLERLRGLTPFNLDTAQRYLLLANDVPGVHVVASLRPSPAGRGAVDLDITVQKDSFDTLAAVQNSGSRALGAWSALARADINSFTRFGERTTLIAYSTLNWREQQVVQLIEDARFGSSGLSGRASLAYGRSRPGDVLKPLMLHGRSVVGTAELDYPLVRLKRMNLVLGAGFDWVDQNTDFTDGSHLTHDQLRVLWLRAQGDAIRRFSNGMAVSASGFVTARRGIDALGATPAGEATLSRFEGRPDAWLVRGGGEGHFSPLPRLDLGLTVQAQYSQKPLLAYEELEVGELTLGRGYDPAAISGDRGVASEFKAEVGPIGLRRNVALYGYGFADVAQVYNLDSGAENRRVRSFGGGFRLQLPWGLKTDVTYAAPQDKTYRASLKVPPSRVLVQIVLNH